MCILLVGVNMAGFFASAVLSPTRTPFAVSSALAKQVLAIGRMDNGQVVLSDPRSIGLDQAGNIYVMNNADKQISSFDPSGKLLRSLKLSSGDTSLRGMAVAANGTIYVSYGGRIHRLDPDGNDTTLAYDEASTGTSYLETITIDVDGSLLAADDSGNILRFEQAGTVKLVSKMPFKTNLNKADSNLILAVDKDGNIYALGKDSSCVLKLSSQGKFLSQFGGENHNHVYHDPQKTTSYAVPALDPGYFYFPGAIAVDHDGRIFVSDGTTYVQIFDTAEKYVDSFRVPDNVQAMLVDSANNLYIVSDTPQVIKLAVKRP
jgi:sugar lactone lactonase YvrE